MKAPEELRADCERCSGLCCVVPAFAKSADFAIDKPAQQPCPNLRTDFRCGIHTRLRQTGFSGCTVYDCFGAGQQVSQVTFGGRDWRAPETAGQMFRVFPIMRALQELRYYLTEALGLPAAAGLASELRVARQHLESITGGEPTTIIHADVPALREAANVLLRRAGELARAGLPPVDRVRGRRIEPGADLIGANLRGADLRGANLRGAYLIGADLTSADLDRADLTGADLRGAQLGGAKLTGSIFLTQSQVDAARGDGATALPDGLRHPTQW